MEWNSNQHHHLTLKCAKAKERLTKWGKNYQTKIQKKLHTVKEITANSYSINRHKKFPLQSDA